MVIVRWLFVAAAILFAPAAHCQNLNVQPEMAFRLAPENAALLDSILPPLPDSVPTAHGWYHVTYPFVAVCGIALPPGTILDGCTTYATRRIEVASSERSRGNQWQTLKHEMAHIMFHDTGISFRTAALEERACDVVATWSLMEQLTAYLAAQP